jgi:L-ascorbate metabolism protein UlaG (beta-lactamase superfamily)
MRLIKYGHACVRLESDAGALVIDPGMFSEREALSGADAVLVTHEHMDHLLVDAVVDEHAQRPGLRVFTHADVAPKLDAIASAVTAVAPGDAFEAAGFRVRAVGGIHAEIHADIPRVANLGYLVDELVYHPGDSLHVPEDTTVDTLLAPISGPWLKSGEVINFLRAVAPRQALAIHEKLVSDTGLGLVDNLFSNLGRTDYRRLAPGEAVTVG